MRRIVFLAIFSTQIGLIQEVSASYRSTAKLEKYNNYFSDFVKNPEKLFLENIGNGKTPVDKYPFTDKLYQEIVAAEKKNSGKLP